MWLPWDYAVALGLALLVLSQWTTRVGFKRTAAAADEAALVAGLYALWQLAGRLSVIKIDGAVERGQALWDWERSVFMPSEAWAQSLIWPYPFVVKAANMYYAAVHVPAMGAFLLWAFFANRRRYGRWRWALAISTGLCLLVQLRPVAPPRLVPGIDMIDAAIYYGQSVYGPIGNSAAGQLQAMPSIHVGWAFLVAAGCWDIGGPRARAIGMSHFVITFIVVAVTANHYWTDGLVAMGFVVGGYLFVRSLEWIRARAIPLRPARSVDPRQIDVEIPERIGAR